MKFLTHTFTFVCLLATCRAVTVSDSFSSNMDYLSTGVAGTIWDGVYFGAGEFANTGGGGDGATLQCDANISAANTLTLQTTGTAWEQTADDGFFLYKVVAGDFSAVVRVVSPYDASPYNTAGLQARAFSAGGDPLGGSENFVSWTRFDQYSFANYLRNQVNGSTAQINPGDYPNSNYWLRMDRVGDTFQFYQRASSGDVWELVNFPAPVSGTSLTRLDLAGQPMQVGLMHATFNGQIGVQFSAFSLTVPDLPDIAAPTAATGLTATPNPDGTATLSWAAGVGSSGSVVVVWTGSPLLKQSPANGFSYSGNASFGLGDPLPAMGYYVVYAGADTSVMVDSLTAGTTYHAAVFAYTTSGGSTTYTHTAPMASFVPVVSGAGPLMVWAEEQGANLDLTAVNTVPGKWYRFQGADLLAVPDWADLHPVAQLATGGSLSYANAGDLASTARFFRVEQFDQPPAGVNLSLEAVADTSYISPWENLTALNDGYEPLDSSDTSAGAYGNWPQTGTQWVEYDWVLPITTSMIDVYWWSDGGGIMAPSASRLLYWNGSSFVPVQNATGLGVQLNQFNTTTFSPVTTTRLRLEFDAGAASTGILEWQVHDAGNSPTNWPGAPESSEFLARATAGALTSLKRRDDAYVTEYVAGGGRVGDVSIKYRQSGTNWLSVQTGQLAASGEGAYDWSTNGTECAALYFITNGGTAAFSVETVFDFANDDAIVWTLNLTNLTGQPLEVGDLAVPLAMNTTFAGPSSSVFKHSFISGHSSFLFWMRPNSVGPYLTLTPTGDTALEYWDDLDGYQAYIHSAAAGAIAAAQGTQWRQTNSALMLSAGASRSYGFKLHWADDYEGVRQRLVDEGQIDVEVVPGMTVPTNLFARLALRTTHTIHSIEPEFPATTDLQFVGTNGDYHIYEVQFSKLGENLLTVDYGPGHQMVLEFFVTEPLETLIRKRGAFIADHQIADASKWYDGLLCEWNMSSGVQLTPDNYDLITGWRIYAVTCDDPGLSKPAYLAAKNARFPVQSEVNAMDNYLDEFVWGGLQRTTNETYAYGIYGIPDWYQNRNSSDTGSGGQLHIWRIYDYPHVVVMYFNMYRVARDNPQITTALTADEYLRRAYDTAVGLYTIPASVTGWSAYQTGLMNELVVVDLIEELEAKGWASEANTLRGHWEQQVDYFVNQNPDLFGSEYSFDSTGFETTHQIAKYAIDSAQTNASIALTNAVRFLEQQMAANLVVRGWLETAYYYLGSDYRATAGEAYVLTYMSQMGGWSVMDYAMNYATNTSAYLRLGYASYLSAWALMNTGTPDSNYGYWYPGAGNDGGCGGGFEPAPYGTTWLGQPHHRGSWYYASETDLGFCGALRTAATVLADDPIFGRFCYGGLLQQAGSTNSIIPLDGVRQRFYAALDSGKLQVALENDRFAVSEPISVSDDLSDLNFSIETENSAAHSVELRLTTTVAGVYAFSGMNGLIDTVVIQSGEEVIVSLPMEASISPQSFAVVRQ